MKTQNLHPILTTDPNKFYKSNLIKARILKIGAIINFLAITIFSIYLFTLIGVTAASLPTAYISIGISVPFFSIFFSKLNFLAKNFFEKASFYKNVIKEYNLLKNQSSFQLRKYLFSIGCFKVKEPKKILRAIATYKACRAQKDKALEEISKIKNQKTINEDLRHINHKLAFQMYEKDVLKNKLKAAEAYHVITHPEDKRNIFDFGRIINKSFSKRISSFFDNSDMYFVFYKKIAQQRNEKKGLTFTEVDNSSIKDISKVIYNV